jgi:hypothetical protein
VELLRHLLETEPSQLAELSEAAVAVKPSPESWSPKEELGHLIDSTANNHQRIVRTLLDDQPAMPGYEQQRWVLAHIYQQRDWRELVDTWTTFNRQLLVVAGCVTDPVTLRFVLEDYLAHMSHHLAHIKAASHAAND